MTKDGMIPEFPSPPFKNVILAKQEMVSKYDYQMGIVLGILGAPEALITDESDVGDFVNYDDEQMDIQRLAELSDIFNCKVALSTKLWQLAKAICWEDLIDRNVEED